MDTQAGRWFFMTNHIYPHHDSIMVILSNWRDLYFVMVSYANISEDQSMGKQYSSSWYVEDEG